MSQPTRIPVAVPTTMETPWSEVRASLARTGEKVPPGPESVGGPPCEESMPPLSALHACEPVRDRAGVDHLHDDPAQGRFPAPAANTSTTTSTAVSVALSGAHRLVWSVLVDPPSARQVAWIEGFVWASAAACRGEDPRRWYPGKSTAGISAALQVCATCAVRRECVEFAIRHGEPGVWGLCEKDRRRIRRARSRR